MSLFAKLLWTLAIIITAIRHSLIYIHLLFTKIGSTNMHSRQFDENFTDENSWEVGGTCIPHKKLTVFGPNIGQVVSSLLPSY